LAQAMHLSMQSVCATFPKLNCNFLGATINATARGTACSSSTQIFSPRAMLQASGSLPCVHEGQMTGRAKFRQTLLAKYGKLMHSCSKRQGATLRWLKAMARCAPWSFSSAWLPIYCTACPKCWLMSRTITYTKGCVPFWLKKLGPQCSTSSCK